MITTFGRPVRGPNVDLATRASTGRRPNDPGYRRISGPVFPRARPSAKLMDRTGYDIFGWAEHTSSAKGRVPHPKSLLMWLSFSATSPGTIGSLRLQIAQIVAPDPDGAGFCPPSTG